MLSAWHRHDRVAIAILAALPVLLFAPSALAGYPVMPGDDHTQNFPLRVLAGELWRHGHLPLLDPYLWSGAPLLGGWNAGAAYPPTLLFAVLPGVAAWTANMIITWWAAGLGTFAFLRASRLSPAASLLGALSFAFAGAMTAQIPHFGLVAGMSWVPAGLLALLRLSQRRDLRGAAPWALLLAATAGMIILAGEPRSIADGVIILVSYAGWRAFRLRGWPRSAAYLGLVLAALALGAAAGAVQWLPGAEVVATSQRAAQSAALFNSGSLTRNRLLLSLVPDLLGGSGSFGQPAFLGTYSLTEVTGYVGIMPLVAACALLAKLRRPLPEWVIWHLVALAGVLLALGGNTPLGRVLVHVPFFGDQRLQSRNLIIADLALAVLLAYWADLWLGEPRARWRARSAAAGRLAGAVPGIAVMAAVTATITLRAAMLHWLGLTPARAAHAGEVLPWLVPSLVLGALAITLAWWGPSLEPARRMRALAWFVAADITVFTLLTVVAVAPGLGHGAPPPPAAATARTTGTETAGTKARPAVPAAAFAHGGRFAIYDPGLLDAGDLTVLGVPDGNVMSHTPSIEGYGSIVDDAYATATGTHQLMGGGQNVLSIRAIGDGTLDQLGTTVLFTPSAYLVTPARGAPARAGIRELTRGRSATWYLGSALPVTSVTVPVYGAVAAGAGFKIGLAGPSGPPDWIAAAPGRAGRLRVSLPRPHLAVAVLVAAASGQAMAGPPVLGAADGAQYRADGPLQSALVPPRWRFSGQDGAFAAFSDAMAKPALTLQPLPHRPATGAFVHAMRGPEFAPDSAFVSSPQGVRVIRAAAAIAGWTAMWRPGGTGPATALTVHRAGLVQAVTVPPGRGTITWTYDAPGAWLGWWVSLAALGVWLAGGVAAIAFRRRSGRNDPDAESENRVTSAAVIALADPGGGSAGAGARSSSCKFR